MAFYAFRSEGEAIAQLSCVLESLDACGGLRYPLVQPQLLERLCQQLRERRKPPLGSNAIL